MNNVVLYNGGNYSSTAATTTTTIYTDNTTYYDPTGLYYPKTQAAPRLAEGSARPEDPFAWLRRRVEEISWQPEIA